MEKPDVSVRVAIEAPNGRQKGIKSPDVPQIQSDAGHAEESLRKAGFFQLFRYADRFDLALLVLGLFGSAVNGCLVPVFSIFFGNLLNAFYEADLQQRVNEVVLYILYVAIISFLCGVLEMTCTIWSGARQANQVRMRYLKALLLQDLAWHDQSTTAGKLHQALNEETAAFQAAIGGRLGNFVHNSAMFVAGIAVAFWRGWDLTLLMLTAVPALVLFSAVVGAFMWKAQAKIARNDAKAASEAREAISNIRTVAAYSLQDSRIVKYANCLDAPAKAGVLSGFLAGLMLGGSHLIIYGAYGLVLWFGSTRVDGQYNGGYVSNVLMAAVLAGFGLGQALPQLAYFSRGRLAAGALYAVLDSPAPRDPHDPRAEVLPAVKGELQFRDLVFKYPTRPDRPALNGLNLAIPAGKTVALVGSSGSGKSTVLQLIQRFYEPTAGQILLDGQDIQGLRLGWLRGQMAIVSQEPVLFATSILGNIALAKPGATKEEVVRAAVAAHADGFISKLPEGYDTLVGEKGTQLSGGQRQRVAIARAMLRAPRILLLDEATSALDLQSEALVQAAIDEVSAGRTTIIVSHRLSSIAEAGCIAVMHAGTVCQLGTHQELLADREGAYAKLVRCQDQFQDLGATYMPHRSPAAPQQPRNHFARRIRESILRKGSARLSVIPVDIQDKLASKSGHVENAPPAASKRLAAMNRPERMQAVLGAVCSAAVGLQMPGFSLALASVTSCLFATDREDVLHGGRKWGLVFMGIGIGCLILEALQGWSFASMGQNLGRRVRLALLGGILHQDIAWFDKNDNHTASVLGRLTNDAAAARGALLQVPVSAAGMVGDQLGVLAQMLSCIVASFTIAFYSSWSMTLVVLAVLPVMVGAQFMMASIRHGANKQADQSVAKANQIASEAAIRPEGLRTVMAYSLEDDVVASYHEQLAKAGVRFTSTMSGIAFGTSQFVLYAVFCLAFWFGGTQVKGGHITFEQMLRAFLAIFYAAFGLGEAQMAFPHVLKAKEAAKRIFEVLDRKCAIDSSSTAGAALDKLDGRVEFRDIYFAYPNRPGRLVFKRFNLVIEQGTSVALVGESGHGKSSILSLLERFYDPVDGQVLVDGIDIRTLNLKWLRSQMALVGQEPVLFSGSVAENISMGRSGATMEEVIEAARAANALEFIEALPQQLNTRVGDGGTQLSGGQRQRIAVARAVLRSAPFLLLDEATSALDAESEALVQGALERLMVGRTTITVAHRLSTVRHATKIAVIYRGRVLEQGTHEELLQLRGYYEHLVSTSQA